MASRSQIIADNIARIRERIAEAAISAGRSANDVELIAVSKYVGIQETVDLVAAGCVSLGESRPQQLWEKAESPELANVKWHLIGHLQRNKVLRTVAVTELIHSVDSLRLLKAIEECAIECGRTIRVLFEVNCSGDGAKHGFEGDELPRALQELPRFPHVTLSGLMTMAALEGGDAVARRNFAALRELRDAVQSECPPGVSLTELSMGMSHDFEAAIREGATMVRIGSLLFEGLPAS